VGDEIICWAWRATGRRCKQEAGCQIQSEALAWEADARLLLRMESSAARRDPKQLLRCCDTEQQSF